MSPEVRLRAGHARSRLVFALIGHAVLCALAAAPVEAGPGGRKLDRAPAALVRKYPFMAEDPVDDEPLDVRLTRMRTYQTRAGDTIRKVAHLLYGHSTWWKWVKDDNKHFLSYRPDDLLPPGKTIYYRAPKVGKEYVVKQNDWLIRIAQWKYGQTDFWKPLYKRNADHIRDPDLIHPGDRLRFYKDGTIRVANTHKIVVHGVKGANARSAANLAREERSGEPLTEIPAEKTADAPVQPSQPQVAQRQAPPPQQPQAGLDGPPVTADPWKDDRPKDTEVAADAGKRGPSSEEEAAPWWNTWPGRAALLLILAALGWALFAYGRSSDLILYPKRGFRGYASDRKPPKANRGPYDDFSLDEDFLDESNVDKIDIRPRPNYNTLWKVWLKKQLNRLRKNSDR